MYRATNLWRTRGRVALRQVTRLEIASIQSTGVFVGQNVGVTQVGERVWLVTFMQYDLGYFDDEAVRVQPHRLSLRLGHVTYVPE